MKKSLVFLIVVLVIGMSGSAYAFYANSGTYMFTTKGNDPGSPNADLTEFKQSIATWMTDNGYSYSTNNLKFYAKTDAPSGTVTQDNGNGSTLDVTYESDNKSGTWTAGANIDFYSVKAGNQYALYWVDPNAASGTWNTHDLTVGNGNNHPEISHISTWHTAESPNPVPVPSTIFLLGIGLISITGIGKLNRQQ